MIITYNDATPDIAPDVRLMPGSQVIGNVRIGAGSSVWFNTVIRGDVNTIRIGKNTNIQDLTMVHCTTQKAATTVGDNCVIGHRAIIHGCTIGDNVLVGMGATIMDNAVVGAGSIVGAGALILEGKQFPPNSLIVGAPAVVKRQLSEDDVAFIKGQADHYRELAATYPENL